jgi:sugar phosphate isomerase/epimerase
VNKIALAPTSLPDTPPLEYVDACAKAGYEAIGLRVHRSPGVNYPFHPVADDKELAKQVKSAIDASGMEVVDILSFYMLPEMDFDGMMAPLEFGKEIGASYALVIGDDPDWNRMVQNFGKFSEIAGKLGMVTAIEAPVVSREVNTLDKAMRLIKESDSKGIVCLDPHQYNRVGHTPAMLHGLDPKLFPYTQLTDGYFDRSKAGRANLGEGDVPLWAILDELTPELPLSLEWPAPDGTSYTSYEWAKLALDGAHAYLNDYYASKK